LRPSVGLSLCLSALLRSQFLFDFDEILPALTKSDICSLDFVINRLFMKLFKTSDMEIMKYYQSIFNFVIISVQIAQEKGEKFVIYMNMVCDDNHDISVNLCCKIDL